MQNEYFSIFSQLTYFTNNDITRSLAKAEEPCEHTVSYKLVSDIADGPRDARPNQVGG